MSLNTSSTRQFEDPTCGRVGEEPGKHYDTIEEAQSVAERLTAHNPVGFSVAVAPDLSKRSPK
jgi:hypothetical protein